MARTSSYTLTLVSLLLAAALGCGERVSPPVVPQQNNAANSNATITLTPRDVVHKAIATYRAAKAYSDRGIVKLSYKQDGETLSDSAPLAVQFAQPNRLHVAAYQAELASNGAKIEAVILDEATGNMDGQLVERPAPKKLTLDDLYADIVLRDTLQSGLGRHPVQLELLLGDAPLLDLLKPETPLALLEPREIDGHRCHTVEAKLADGVYVFWFDELSFLLRRIEYPAEKLLPELAKNHGVTDLAVVADFRDATFAPAATSADTFTIKRPATAKKTVRYFVLPPQALPSDLFGKMPGDFKLTTAAGEALTAAELAGKIAVLVWFANDPASAYGLRQVQEALNTVKSKDKFAIYAVAVEDRNVKNDMLAGALKEWEVAMPLARDFDLAGRDIFSVRKAPQLIVLDAAGRVQIFDEAINPSLPQTLPVILERLAAGDDLAKEILADAKKAQEQYAQDLIAAADAGATTAVVDLAASEPAAKREPDEFQRTALWTTEAKALTEPGNFLIVRDKDKEPRIYVVDGSRTVVELDAAGKVLHQHKLELPIGSGISYLRTAVGKDGKRWFAGSALLGKHAFVFDEQWKLKFSYPPDDQPHEGLHAIALADLADDGEPELYVGFWSLLGVQYVTLSGERKWTERSIPTVLSLVATPQNDIGWRKLLASGDRGFLYRMNEHGHRDPQIEVAQRQIHRLSAAAWEPALATTFCGISYPAEGRLLAIGLDAELKEVWNYKLPAGQFSNQIEFVTSGRLRDDDHGEWIMAGPDGSVQIVSDDGEFSDSFALGDRLTGIATAKLGDARVILTATKSGVTAWKLEKK